jgi:transcriptional regulator with XRE-family HTH domain
MATRQRPADRGSHHGRELYLRIAAEFRSARLDRDLALLDVGRAVGLSASAVSRIERGLIPATSMVRMAELCAVVGLELAARAYPGGQPMRDAGHTAFVAGFLARIHRTWKRDVEVPLPIQSDKRAWDALISIPSCRYGVEVEMAPRDGQALARRLQLKQRDGEVDGILLVLPRTRHTREFLAGSRTLLATLFPVGGVRAMELLAAGVDPGGGSVIVIDRYRLGH